MPVEPVSIFLDRMANVLLCRIHSLAHFFTGMAAPHVTGAIAKAWSRCPACSASTVESCLEDSAKLESFMTPYLYAFGKGVVKAEDMYDCLNGICGCDM
jgi:hypothetical protein